jgi:hypothetical protein
MTFKRAILLMFAALAFQLATPAPAQRGTDNTETSVADGTGNPNKGSPALTGERRPLYRLRKSDVVQVRFTFTPEFDQELTVQPDGFVSLKSVGDLLAEGLTLADLHDSIAKAYQPSLRDPEVSVTLKDFERPFFVAGGFRRRGPGRAPRQVRVALSNHCCRGGPDRRRIHRRLKTLTSRGLSANQQWHCRNSRVESQNDAGLAEP